VIATPDMRYAGLTPAQWFTIGFFMIGIYLLFFRKPKESDFAYAKDSDRIAREKGVAAGASEAEPPPD
jgi:phosphatidylglycerol:prolipoprotein diacylglycerol transferase